MTRIISLMLFSIVCRLAIAEEDFSKSLVSLGIEAGMPYQEVKGRLMANGWEPDTSDLDSPLPYEQYPEVSCGSGHDAVCSVGYKKGKDQNAILVEYQNGGLVFSGSY